MLEDVTNGMGFRGIERVEGVHHTTIIHWVKQVGEHLPDAYDPETVPEVGEVGELETVVGAKKQNLAVDSRRPLHIRDIRLGARRPQR